MEAGELNPYVPAPGSANERVCGNIANGLCSKLLAIALAIGPRGLLRFERPGVRVRYTRNAALAA